MNSIHTVTLEVNDPETARAFYTQFGVDSFIEVRPGTAPTSGFRGYTLSLLVTQPRAVDHFAQTALDAGATSLKQAAKSLWGYGAVVQAPDGAIWKIATTKKRDPVTVDLSITDVVLLLGAHDVALSKRCYLDHGFEVRRSFGSRYVEFTSGRVTLGLYRRAALAKDVGVPPEGDGSHRLLIGTDAAPFTDPDGFQWQSVSANHQRTPLA